MSDDRNRMLAEIADAAASLTDRFRHRQPYEVWDHNRHRRQRFHEVWHDGLLDQLRDMFTADPPAEPGAMKSNGESPPAPLNMEAASLHTVITVAAFRWCNRLDVDQRDTVQDNVRALVGAAAATTSDVQREVLADMRSWQRRALVLTGWASAPFRPNAVCPWCDRKGVLVINLEAKSGFCANDDCGAAWRETADEHHGSIYVLAEHIRQTTDGSEAA